MSLRIKTINIAAIYVAICVFLVSGIINYSLKNDYLTIFGSSAILSFATYVIGRFVIWKLTIHRLKPLYQVITGRNMTTLDVEKRFEKGNVMTDVGGEISSWAKNKADELHHLKNMELYRKEFLGNVSHELKTPLFTLQGYILTLMEGGINNEEINMRYLMQAENNIERMINIVKDLETISKLEIGTLLLNREKFDIVEMCENIVDSLAMKAQERSITMRVVATEPIYVYADKSRYEQVLVNLLINSVNYGKNNGETTISFVDMFDKVMIEVADTGIGINKNDMPRIFERFYRVDESRSRNQGGTGLGLAIAKHIIEAHGEMINMRSEINKGTTFSFGIKRYL